MPRIFLSYRRSDTASDAGRLYSDLQRRFGRKSIFKDVDSIQPGEDFVEKISWEISKCDIFLILIGPDWLTVDQNGFRRIDWEMDTVRQEIEVAFHIGLRVLPVCVRGGRMPDSSELPESVGRLTRINAARLRLDPDYEIDLSRIIESVNRLAALPKPKKPKLARPSQNQRSQRPSTGNRQGKKHLLLWSFFGVVLAGLTALSFYHQLGPFIVKKPLSGKEASQSSDKEISLRESIRPLVVDSPPNSSLRIPTAKRVEGRQGFVYSPYNLGRVIDVTGIPSGKIVADPDFEASLKMYFKVP